MEREKNQSDGHIINMVSDGERGRTVSKLTSKTTSQCRVVCRCRVRSRRTWGSTSIENTSNGTALPRLTDLRQRERERERDKGRTRKKMDEKKKAK